MKINEVSNSLGHLGNLDSAVIRNREENNSAENLDQNNSQSGAKVEISNRSVEIQKAAEKMDLMPEERARRIEELKVMVKNDVYRVDSEKIADKIVNDSLFKINEP